MLTLLILALQLLSGGADLAPHADFPPGQCPSREWLPFRLRGRSGGPPSPALFPFRAGRPDLQAARCHWIHGQRIRATLTLPFALPGTLATGSGGASTWSFQFALDPASGTGVLTSDRLGRTLFISRRHGVFAVSRTRLLGLARCEKLQKGLVADWLVDAFRRLLDPAEVRAPTAILQFAYGRGRQLWLSRTGLLEVRVLHAGSRTCAVQRSWHAASTGPFNWLMVEHASSGLDTGADNADLRLPSACYRVEL